MSCEHTHGCDCGCSDTPLFEELAPVLDAYADVPGSLITILQKAQELYGYLSPELMLHISRATAIPVAKIYGVATFYAQFRLNPVGKNLIMLCQGTACHVNGSKMIEEAIVEHLGIAEGETTEDGLFTLENVACLGCCSLSPVMMINGETYGQLTKDKVVAILDELRAKEAE
ncbi:MAG: NADH-quinone oxidoreductase subunit NuoE [Eubacterium sp.]|nr:NADH-quinone oxidoreductase subunit NuoE [Eubacterium sp.]